MNKTIGIIGAGNMAYAIISGIVKSSIVEKERIIVSNPTEVKLLNLRNKLGVITTTNNKEVAEKADILILAVKPNIYKTVIGEVKSTVKEDVILVTIAAGISLDFMENTFEKPMKVVRTMPNTPALVGEGMTAICHNAKVQEKDLNEVITIFNSFGKTEIISEKLMDAIPAVSGSSPAYVYMMLEALADGAVLSGIPRDKAYKLAAQAVLGAAKMVLDTGEHPGSLKDKVCSPGGTTIEAVYTLEKSGFRAAIINAMEACTEKTKKMTKEANKL